jgi:hypothetical protein
MKINKGLYQDIRPHDQPQGTYPFGKNGIQDHIKNVVFNEPGHNIDPAEAPFPVRGVIEVDRGRAVIFTTDGVTSEIGYYDRTTNVYSKILGDSDLTDTLDFGLDHWITGEFQRNFKDEVVITWTDKDTFPKYLNIDDVSGITNTNQLRLFLNFQTPTITAEAVTGGSLERGSYFVGLKYLVNDGSSTDLTTVSKPVAIFNIDNVSSLTDKAVSILVTNLDTDFDKIQFVFISKVNGNFTAVNGPQLEIPESGTITYVYTGDELFETITLEEVVIPGARYSKVGTMGQLNDALYLADLEKEPELNLQKYANIINVRFKSELIDIVPETPIHVNGTHKSLMHGEVYAIYIRYHQTSGQWTKFFTIPGHLADSNEFDTDTSVHGADAGAKNYQVYDYIYNVNNALRTADTAVWYNQNELYPTTDSFDSTSLGGADLRGTPVRHHKMPTVSWTWDQWWSNSVNKYFKSKADILSLEISNVQLPPELIGLIDGYEIGIAKRTPTNSTIQGQSLLLLAAQPTPYENGVDHVVSTGGNWHSSTIDDVGSGATADFSQAKALRLTGRHLTGLSGLGTQTPVPGLRFRFHGFDLLFNRPAISPTLFQTQLKFRVNNLGDEAHGFLEDGELSGNRVPVMGIIDYTGADANTPAGSQYLRVIESHQYLPNNVNTGVYDNTMLETAFVGKMKWIGAAGDTSNNDVPLNVGFVTVNKADNQEMSQRFSFEESYLTNLLTLRADAYNNFYSQVIYPSGEFLDIANATNYTYPGDTFISPYTFHTYGWFDAENHPGDDAINPATDGGFKIVRRFVTEQVSNINLRFEIPGNIYSQWWPHNPLTPQPSTPTGYLYTFDRNFDPNQFGYTKDLNAFAEFLGLVPYNPYFVDVTTFPYRIQRGGKLPKTGNIRSWRNFLPLDFYDMQKNMGRINRILGLNDKLIIHTENAIFRTQDKMKLEADILSVTLGTGDIFQFEPQQTFDTKQGYAGTQHELAAVLTPIGYVFVDAKMGEVYLFRDGLKMINEGMSIFLRQYLKEVADQKNVFSGNGITIGYDPDYKRILLTVKNQQLITNLGDFVPNYEATPEFFDDLDINASIVYKDGRYQLFRGANDPEITEVDCPVNHAPETDCGEGLVLTVDEGSAANTVVGSVFANFSDSDADLLYFSILGGNAFNTFFIDALSGVIKVSGLYEPDFDTTPSYILTIRATDPYGLYAECDVTVNVNDIHLPAIIYPNQVFTVCDGAAGDTVAAAISASPQEGGTVTYGFDPDFPADDDGTFAINVSTGEVTVTGTIDMGITATYTLHVAVFDTIDDDTVVTKGIITINVIACEGSIDPTEFTGYGEVSAPDVCSGGTPITLYTNGVLATGKIVYTDIGLSTPYLGFNYLIVTSDGNHIYTINPSTGNIEYDVGTSCP